ncbi:MAG: hypothetical protein BroJett025_07150 [Patescibacteria group bacterium]|nr:MAG: hypothetical protein BroJett025_07150 [Patescibacteria group bacterium]
MKLKIVCLNVWIGGILFDEIVAFLREQNADIVLLQEVYNGDASFTKKQYRTLSELQTLLGYQYAHFAPAFLEDAEGKEVVQGNAILSKLPLTEVSVTFYDVGFGKRDANDNTTFHITPRNLQHIVADLNGIKLHVLNTQGIWGTNGDDNERRLHMSDHILKESGNSAPLIFAGDLNVNEKTETVKRIEKKLTNVFKNQLVTSFNLKRKDLVQDPGYATSVVDMLFVSPDIKVLSASVPQVDVSDHLPLVCEIEL